MPQPTPYDRITNLQNDQALAPSAPHPAPVLDQEYNAIKITTDEIIQNLSLIQRDDGELANNSVGFEQLEGDLLLGFAPPTAWETDEEYEVNDTVFFEDGFYHCLEAHTSGVFATDLSDGKWAIIADFGAISEDAQTAAAAAEASATAAAESADDAAAAALDATAAQGAFRWDFDGDTSMVDPGAGDIKFNNAALASVTAVAISALTADTGNPNVLPWIITWDDSTNPARGTIYIRRVSDPENFVIFNLTGAVANNGTWAQLVVTYLAHSGSLTAGEPVSVAFARTGNVGASGAGSGDMLAASNLSDLANKPTSRTNLGVGVGDIPAFSQVLLSAATTAATHAATKSYVDTTAVSVGGGTMTGDLAINHAQPRIYLDKTNSANSADIYGFDNDVARWLMQLGTGTASDFFLWRANDAGSPVDAPISILRATGKVLLNGDPTAALHAATKGYVDEKTRFNVKAYGAVGDNATDDTAAIQAAITAAGAVNGEVYFPSGKYAISATLVITPVVTPLVQFGTITGNVSLRGDGFQQSFIRMIPGSFGHLLIINSISRYWTGYRTLQTKISDLALVGDSTGIHNTIHCTDFTATGVEEAYAFAPTMENVFIDTAGGYGLYLGTARSHGLFTNVFIYYCNKSCVYSQGNGDHVFMGCNIGQGGSGYPVMHFHTNYNTELTSCDFWNAVAASNIKIEGAGTNCSLSFVSCTFNDAAHHGVEVNGGLLDDGRVALISCQFFNNSKLTHGTYSNIQANSRANVVVLGCQFSSLIANLPAYHIQLTGTLRDVQYAGNVHDSGAVGISLTNQPLYLSHVEQAHAQILTQASTGFGGSNGSPFTTATGTVYSLRVGPMIHCIGTWNITTNGAAATGINLPLARYSAGSAYGIGDYSDTGAVSVRVLPSPNTVVLIRTMNTYAYPGGNGAYGTCTFSYPLSP